MNVTTYKWIGVVYNRPLGASVFRRCAAKREVGATIQAVRWDGKVKERASQLLVPDARVFVRARNGIRAIRETLIAVIEVTAGIAEAELVADSVRDVACV